MSFGCRSFPSFFACSKSVKKPAKCKKSGRRGCLTFTPEWTMEEELVIFFCFRGFRLRTLSVFPQNLCPNRASVLPPPPLTPKLRCHQINPPLALLPFLSRRHDSPHRVGLKAPPLRETPRAEKAAAAVLFPSPSPSPQFPMSQEKVAFYVGLTFKLMEWMMIMTSCCFVLFPGMQVVWPTRSSYV